MEEVVVMEDVLEDVLLQNIAEGFKEASEEAVEEADKEGADPAGGASRLWPAWPQSFALGATAGSGSSSADLEEGFEEASEEAAEEGPDPAGRSSGFPCVQRRSGVWILLGLRGCAPPAYRGGL